MAKLAPSLKALINAPAAKPFPVPAPPGIADLSRPDPVYAAELIREVGLKCISFNGIPRTINCLNAFRAALPAPTAARLCAAPSRAPPAPAPATLAARAAAGRALWDSVYRPFEAKLLHKLALAHPDLPVVIMHGHYALLLADPADDLSQDHPVAQPAEHGTTQPGEYGADRPGDGPGDHPPRLARLGRALTSLTAIACLRAQGGVAPQVVSHVFGLRKAVEDGSYRAAGGSLPDGDGAEDEDEGVRWLAGDEGGEWVLRTVDSIAEALGGIGMARL
ncbi:Dol-P-Man:Man(5)GlcNAc(2)-PP-Dol alpha-1 [Escovopsis weberi]|uniref:Dol-P-Man:Man(5)GlcNAc(2)-PP-Dol alpha-1 n=1 Tax=Escovopsis weberi TaxID=150374 RepID=A0A0M8MQJ8_ESCWE|nr:Dol-P-Man:Man(5)GlcNAc(2)-PP-Dol alpha-1 [Escovopsis weberi]